MYTIREDIRTLLKEIAHLPVDITSLGDDADLYEAGLSSYDTVHLMLALEEKFEIEFPDSMLNRRSFESVATMHAVIAELQAGKDR